MAPILAESGSACSAAELACDNTYDDNQTSNQEELMTIKEGRADK